MSSYVAVDSATPPGGNQYFIVGVVVEISDQKEFQEYYFEKVRKFISENRIELPFPVLKSRTVVENIPSYHMRDKMDHLLSDLIRNPAISRLNVSIGWYGCEVDLEFKDSDSEPIKGIEFASNYLSQYFNVVALWRYHRSHNRNLASTALVDNIQGHITKAWQYCGNVFDMSLVPNGDLTYPSISTADIIAYNLSAFLSGHEETKFTNFPELAEDYLINRRNRSTKPYVKADPVNERETDHIVPTLPYTIQDHIHYPHPVAFVHDTVLSGEDKSVLPRTDFHSLARKWAFDREGCVVNLKATRLPAILRGNDIIIHTKGTDDSTPQLLQDLHPTKDIVIMDSDELIRELTAED